jgi:hypothetical protein
MRRRIIGDLLKASGAIPVERPQDVKQVKGQGVLVSLRASHLTGKDTKFTKLTEGTSIHMEGAPVLKIKSILSDI